MKELYLIVGYNDFFGQTRKPWVSIDTSRLVSELENLGYIVHKNEFHEIVNGKVKIENQIVFYTFSHRLNLQQYIRDCLLYLLDCGNTLIPSYELFCCHENKGWQVLLRRKLGIEGLWNAYFSSKRELKDYEIKYPVVLKTITGSNAKGVFLVKDEEDLLKKIKSLEKQPSIAQKLDFVRRKYFRKYKKIPGYPDYDLFKDAQLYQDYITPEIPFVLQELIPNLTYDYRVIALGEKYFVSKRLTRKNDFRASGAKRFTFDFPVPVKLLDFARELHHKIHSPYLSIDVGENEEGDLYLFEFQVEHFGINAIVLGKGYYVEKEGKWEFVEEKTPFEKDLAYGLDLFLSS